MSWFSYKEPENIRLLRLLLKKSYDDLVKDLKFLKHAKRNYNYFVEKRLIEMDKSTLNLLIRLYEIAITMKEREILLKTLRETAEERPSGGR